MRTSARRPGPLPPEAARRAGCSSRPGRSTTSPTCAASTRPGSSETVERFNEHAAHGVDPDYGRGESAYNRALGDPNHRVHPCLGPIDEPPYYAVQVVPGDIGTCGGLLTDEHARVIGQDDRPIEGLYATGNGTATVMGRHYLGPGASIANTMVFGYVAARHATHVRDGDA